MATSDLDSGPRCRHGVSHEQECERCEFHLGGIASRIGETADAKLQRLTALTIAVLQGGLPYTAEQVVSKAAEIDRLLQDRRSDMISDAERAARAGAELLLRRPIDNILGKMGGA